MLIKGAASFCEVHDDQNARSCTAYSFTVQNTLQGIRFMLPDISLFCSLLGVTKIAGNGSPVSYQSPNATKKG